MALQELSRPPVETGYSQLGATLSGIGDRIGQQRRQDQLMAQAREQQLADYDRTRAAQLADYSRTRADTLTDQGTRRGEFLSDVTSARADADRVDKRKRGEASDDRAEARYFAEQDKQDARLWNEISADLALARKTRAAAKFTENLQGFSNYAAENLTVGQRRTADVMRIIESVPRTYKATDGEVLNAAQIAAGSQDKKLITLAIPKVLEQMNTDEFIRHNERVATARVMLNTVAASNREWADLIQFGMSKEVAPNGTPPRISSGGEGPAALSTTPAPTGVASLADLEAALPGGRVAPVPLVARPAPEAPPPPAMGAQLQPPPAYTYPAHSILGLGQRIGANLPTGEQLAMAPANIAAFPGRVLNEAGKIGGTGLQGIMTGDYSYPDKGWLEQAGEGIGQMWMDAQNRRTPLWQPRSTPGGGRPITTGPMIFPTPVR
jgi:hypothetical protein